MKEGNVKSNIKSRKISTNKPIGPPPAPVPSKTYKELKKAYVQLYQCPIRGTSCTDECHHEAEPHEFNDLCCPDDDCPGCVLINKSCFGCVHQKVCRYNCGDTKSYERVAQECKHFLCEVPDDPDWEE